MPDSQITDEVPLPSAMPLEALYRHASERPDAIALISGDDVWSYQRLADGVAQLSSGLRHAGIQPGDRILAVARTSPLHAVFMFAAMMTGAILVPVRAEFKAGELDDFLRVVRPAFFIYEPDLQDVVSQINPARLEHVQTFLTDDDGARSWRHLLVDAHRQGVALPEDIDSVFLLLATSGTTGKPKLVAYSQRVISHMLGAARPWVVAGYDSCLIGSTQVAHVSGTITMMAALVNGCKEILLSRFDADMVLDAIEQYRGTTMFVAPFLCMPLIHAQRKRARDVRSLLVCSVGGDACRPQIAEEFETTFNVQLHNAYGLTECIGSAFVRPGWRTIRAVPGRARLVDTNGDVVPAGEVGELQTRGPNLSLGYWTGPGDIASHTRDGWFPTGDLVVQDAEGNYQFVGRSKDLIVYNANKIAPAEVENELIKHAAVADAAVAGAHDDKSGQRVVALIKLTDEGQSANVEAGAILSWMESRMAAFKVPELLVFVDAIPRNALGKIDRIAVARIATSV
uniref:AMP-binding enzyme n=1 Tax=Burkholderia sp. M701 TaxID=326454 RepID=V5YQC4_9BURK|nr:class I adenylate-forming enzyme family protein [Burkholderia sp. M701]BAO19141.1 putative AMP-binding enzyme [Burkholderia sp. M701]